MTNLADLITQFGSLRRTCETEAAFLDLWRHQLAGLEPVAMAFAGGLLSDRMAWVFASGYQATMRAVFDGLPDTGWAAFCVSEGRNDLPPLVSIGKNRIDGWKTWVAGSSVLDQMIVKVGRGPDAFFLSLPTDRPGITLSAPAPGAFLAELSQGMAQFAEVQWADADRVQTDRLRMFAPLEPAYIYLAFCGHVHAQAPERCEALAHQLIEWLTGDDLENLSVLARVDQDLQDLVTDLDSAQLHSAWPTDQRLIKMYSPGIQKRASS